MKNEAEDRRSRRSRRLLKEGLLALMQEKRFSDITVRDITERMDLNRGTFYLHYPDTTALLQSVETDMLAEAQALIDAQLPAFSNIPIFAGYTLENLPYVLFVSAGVAGIGFCAYFLAMEYQPASVVSLVYFFKPALSPVLAWLLHGEVVSPNMLLGIVLIVAGSLCSIIPGILEAKGHRPSALE